MEIKTRHRTNRYYWLLGGTFVVSAIIIFLVLMLSRKQGPTPTTADSAFVESPTSSSGLGRQTADSATTPVQAKGSAQTSQSDLGKGSQLSRVLPSSNGAGSDSQGPSDSAIGANDEGTTDARADRQFPVSPSIAAQCGVNPIPNKKECDLVSQFLRMMSDERRDEGWASATEAKLRDHAESISSDVEIRALECRQTLCALEVATMTGNLDLLTWQQVLSLGVDDRSHFLMGFEPDPSGAQKKIFLRVYERR
jgi:hypothetical protein